MIARVGVGVGVGVDFDSANPYGKNVSRVSISGTARCRQGPLQVQYSVTHIVFRQPEV